MSGLFVTGTGTGVGKSVVAAAIVAALTAQGKKVAAFKPAVSGLDEITPGWPPDHELLAAATGWQSPDSVSPFTFGPPVSPHLAARDAGVSVTLDALTEAYERAAAAAEVTICEGVGGLMVPLSDDPDLSVLDFAKSIGLPAVVATHPGLGTISDTRLTVDRLESEGVPVAAVVISGWPQEPSAIELSNLETLARLLRVDVATLPITSPERLAADAADLPITRWLSKHN
ncbi:MAG: dethiobiotin synthase [Thermoleophilaceae bacterium]|nr:dethiobiotin synthase [Thermoleophilaceae bacterium]